MNEYHYKTCGICGEEKLIEEFYLNRHGNPKSLCATCENRRNTDCRKTNANRLAYKRALSRAKAAIALKYAAEVKDLTQRFLPGCLEEIERMGGPRTLLKPGNKKAFEDIEDRIADPKCEDCEKAHRHGHACDTCGSSPEHEVRVIRMTEGQMRFSRTETVVLRP